MIWFAGVPGAGSPGICQRESWIPSGQAGYGPISI